MSKSNPVGTRLKYVVCDIEANGLLYDVDTVHCMVLRTYDGDVKTYYDGPLLKGTPRNGSTAQGVQDLRYYGDRGYKIVGHNFIGYDLPMLHKLGLVDAFKWNPDILDTYIGVSLRFPEEMPGLDHWGRKFGVLKPVHEDWTTLSPEMVHRCQVDTAINQQLLKHLIHCEYLTEEWDAARDLEQQVLWIHSQQVLHGMRVDVMHAANTLRRIDDQIRRLSVMIHKDLPQVCKQQGVTVSKPFKADGTLTKMASDWFDGMVTWTPMSLSLGDGSIKDPVKSVRICGPFSRIYYEPVNLNSHPQLKALMLSLGWVPTAWNYKKDKGGQFIRDEKGGLIPTSPKLTEDSYGSLPPGLGQNIAEILQLKHRRRFIQNEKNPSKGLLGFVRDDGRVECEAFTCGTNTGRYRHSGAFVNLPKVSTPWGPEIRSIFCVPGDRFLVGIDLDGIEARIMGHFASFYDGGAFAKEVLQGDVHQMTANAMGIDRETAKTFRYAISYGAGVGKLKEILGCGERKAKQAITKFWSANPGLSKLIEVLETEYEQKGYITGIDGRHLYIRHKHKLFNTLIQNAATVTFKKWMVRCYEETLDITGVNQVLAYHDELGFEVNSEAESVAQKWGDRLADAARIVGEDMELNVPISAEAKVGKRYDEVH